MAEIISKQEFDKLMKMEGKVRGMGMRGHAEFILVKEGEEGLRKLEQTITNLGYPVKYKELKLMGFYPIGLEIATLVAIKRIFNYEDEKFEEIGGFGVKSSFLLRLFMKYMVSIQELAKRAPAIWEKGGDLGDLKIGKYNVDERTIALRIEDFNANPLYCQLFKGYFSKGLQMVIGKKPSCIEEKCTFRGDECHEFVLRW